MSVTLFLAQIGKPYRSFFLEKYLRKQPKRELSPLQRQSLPLRKVSTTTARRAREDAHENMTTGGAGVQELAGELPADLAASHLDGVSLAATAIRKDPLSRRQAPSPSLDTVARHERVRWHAQQQQQARQRLLTNVGSGRGVARADPDRVSMSDCVLVCGLARFLDSCSVLGRKERR